MRKLMLAFLLLTTVSTSISQTFTDYGTVVDKFHKFYNSNKPDSVFGLFSDRVKGIIPIDKTKTMLHDLSANFGDMKFHEFTRQDEHFYYYKTVFVRGQMTLVVALNKDKKLQSFRFIPYSPDTAKSNILLAAPEGYIFGTITRPETEEKVSVVMIIPGSGPTDRNGNNSTGQLNTNAYLMIADSLRKHGIACLRYDKRSVGESANALKDESTLSFDDMVSDALGFIKLLKSDSRFSKVYVLGHSEGSLIGMIAASQVSVGGYISVAGVSERADKIIEKQLSARSIDMAAKAKIILDSMVKGYAIRYIDPALSAIFRPAMTSYMISWLQYDPRIEIKKVTARTLIVQGTADLQVGAVEAEALKKANPHATLKLIKGMNHVLKQAPEDPQHNFATYSDPYLSLCPGFIPAIVQFIKGN